MATLEDILGGGLPAGLLTPEQEAAANQRAQNAGLLNLAFGLLQASQGQVGQPRPTLGRVIGQAGPVGVQAYQQSFENTLQNALRGMQIQEMRRKQQEAEQLRTLSSQMFDVTRAPPPTTGAFDVGQGIDVMQGGAGIVPPQPITGVRIKTEMLPALAAVPGGVEQAKSMLQLQEALKAKQYTLKPGEQVIEEGGRVIAGIPSTPEKIDLGTHVAFVDPSNPTKIIGTILKGKDTEKLTSQELQVGQQFANQAQPFIQIGQAYKKIEVAAKNPSAAGDISLIFGYMKLLDPGSVVREGEFATAQNAGSIPQSIYGMYNKALSGERLAPTVRNDFLNQAKNLISSQKEIFDATIKPKFESIVKTNGLTQNNVMFNPFEGIDVTKQPPTGNSLVDQARAELARRQREAR